MRTITMPSTSPLAPALALALALVATLATPAASFAQTTRPDRDHIRVGTWNLEKLGSREPARTEEDYKKIAGLIQHIGVDVLAVQEVNGAPPLRRLRTHLGKTWQFVIGTSGGFRGQETRISVGLLWNTLRVQLRQCEEMLEFSRRSNGLPIFHRLPVCAVFAAVRPDGKRF